MSKAIRLELSEAGITKAISEIFQYRDAIEKKTELLRKRVAEEIARKAQSGFSYSMTEDGKSPDVRVSVEENGSVSVVVASGQDAVWVEFGSGVFFNTPAGTSPHPKGQELGYVIGGYGKGKGASQSWYYYDAEMDQFRQSFGTPATMPMYHAMEDILNEIPKIAEEVFK